MNSTSVIFIKNGLKIDLCSDAYELSYVSLSMVIDMATLHFDTRVNDLDLHSSSHGYEKTRLCVTILL